MNRPKEYSHCTVCRRRLKNPKYRHTGIGPKCEEKFHKKKESHKAVQMELNFG